MFSMTLICMGKLKEKFYIQASEEYKKRLGAFCDFTLLELPEVRLPENPNETQILQGLSKEAELIRAKVPKGSWLCILAPEGKMLSSEELAGKLSEIKKSGKSSVCFLIGSSFGVDAGLKKQADLLLSMSSTARRPFRRGQNITNRRWRTRNNRCSPAFCSGFPYNVSCQSIRYPLK